MRGQVTKIHSGRYSVFSEGKIFTCVARGVLKIKSLGIVTGDYVEFDEKALTVNKVVLPRKSCFIRPSVANVDAVNIVIALPPKPDYLMIDKLIISLMAQAGSFVPATSAELCVVDGIYTRIGASDDLASGSSTFMVEMNEVADILKNATSKSLIIFDEIGRGTSTFDGMSIARAVLEFAADKRRLGAKTLFATHYHELTELEESVDGVRNYNIAVKKRGDDITFLRRIVPGCADGSYGIEVAKLAGVPNSVVERAKVVLNELETEGVQRIVTVSRNEEESQISFGSSAATEIVEKLKKLDVNTLTPIEAMTVLYELAKQANN